MCLKFEMKFNLIWNAKMILTKLHSKFYLQELLQVFTDQNEKLERKNQDNQEARICKICMDEEVIFSKIIIIIIKAYFQKYFYFIFRCLTFWTLATMPFVAILASKTFEIVPFVEISFIIHQWFTFHKKINGAFAHRIQINSKLCCNNCIKSNLSNLKLISQHTFALFDKPGGTYGDSENLSPLYSSRHINSIPIKIRWADYAHQIGLTPIDLDCSTVPDQE